MSSSVNHPVFARLYTRLIAPSLARQGGDELRRRVLSGLSGTVVEVGAGDGANFAHYPETVGRVIAVEPESHLRARAGSRADERVVLRDADAADLPLGDGEADAVVFCLVLCSVPSQATALAEARRVLRPDGELRFLEHVQAAEPGAVRRLQGVLDTTLWPRLCGGCHLGRDTAAAIEHAGFDVVEIDRFSFPDGARGPSSSVILGRAVRS
jgi:ubiquinone/menaquinone biosynthesis C-methylase UbiE